MFRRPLTRLENNISDLAEYEATRENRRIERNQKQKQSHEKSIPKTRDEKLGVQTKQVPQKIILETPKVSSRF